MKFAATIRVSVVGQTLPGPREKAEALELIERAVKAMMNNHRPLKVTPHTVTQFTPIGGMDSERTE